MIRLRFTYIALLVFAVATVFSQTSNFNNGWINYTQKYYKIKIANDNIYKLDSTSLAHAGVPIGTINPQNIQLFQKGKELYSYIAGEADSVLNTNDFILFYAEKNNGTDDSTLFSLTPGTPFITNPYYSVINDTAIVYLTWNVSTNNKRLTLNTDTAFSSYNSSPYYMRKVFSPQTNYSFGPYNNVNQNDPRFQTGEGFVAFYNLPEQGNASGSQSTFSFPFNTSAAYTSGPTPYATICFSGANDISFLTPDHLIDINYQGQNTLALGSYSLDAYDNEKYTYALNAGNFGTANTIINLTSLPNPGSGIDNIINVNYIGVTYPQTFNMLGQMQEKIYLPDDASQAKSKLSITNFNNQGAQSVLIDNNNHKITFLPASSSFQVLVPNSGSNNFCFLSSLANAPNSNSLSIKPINGNGTFVNYLTQGNLDSVFIIISNPKLIDLPATGVTQYANFRRNDPNGGHYNTLVASVNDLYDQFAFGVERHPLSIKNFCGYLIANATTNHIRPPSNLFLIGKGTHAWEGIYRDPNQPVNYADLVAYRCFVPSFGNPSTDVLLTEGLPGSSIFPEPAIPTGRLSAQTDQEVLNYFSKVQQYVAQPADDIWKKTAIDFIGGNSPSDQQTFNTYMSVLKGIYESTQIGGNVFSFYKTSTAPISINTNDSVTTLINQGVSLMTFFGHGSPTGFDQNIDAPSAYNNAPKIPFIIANSCYTGDMFSVNDITNSEEWVLAPNNKGAIGYIATTAEGVAQQLFIYTQELYNQFCKVNYGLPYGNCMKNTIRNVMTNTMIPADAILQVETCMEMTLHGDPAIKANTVAQPDYQITGSDLIFDTKTYPGDSIGVKIVMTNIGKAVAGAYSVKLTRVFPTGDTAVIYKTVTAPLYQDTLSFFMYENYINAIGVNTFSVYINFAHLISSEVNYANNSIGPISLFIKGSDIEPVWPYKYAIVPNIQKVNLKASTADAFAPLTSYRFQMDTSNTFNSPVLTNTLVSAVGGVVTLPNVSLLNLDSVVYFWRVAKDASVPDWNQSSFQVIKNKYGWEQAQFYQFNHDGYQYVQFDSAHRKFNFVNSVNTIGVNTTIVPANDPLPQGGHSFTEVQFYINNAQAHLWSCGVDGWVIGIFNPITGKLVPGDSSQAAPSYNAAQGSFNWLGKNGNCICDEYTNRNTYDFGTQNQCAASKPDVIDWRPNLQALLDTLKPGTPIIAYTVKASYDTLYRMYPVNNTASPGLIAAFHSIGSTKIDSLNDTTSLIIFGKKTLSGSGYHATEVMSHNQYDLISLVDTLNTHFDNGYIASEIIGPAQRSDSAWKSLHWRFKSLPTDTVPSDSIVLQLIGIDSLGVKTVMYNFPDTSLDILNLSTYMNQIPGKFFPYIQLVAQMADNKYHTPPQLKRWQVIFDQVPEAALYPSGGFTVVSTSTVSEGQNLQLRMPIKNVSDFPFKDSLLVTYYVQDANRNNHALPFKLKRKPFLPDSVIFDTITVSTVGFGGADIFGIDVNPPGKPKYQSEQFHFNNIAQFGFTVNKDKINPILDVTFDGTHILSGDIVSAKPDILVSLKDENKFLALNDTGNFAVYITPVNSTTQQRIYFNSGLLQFTPAVLPNNSCKINYRPSLTQDGLYGLDIKATDRTGNLSGQFDYKISYEVINKPMITEVLNYPNPFSTSTKFVFTITGTDVPETFKIQIMTITGKVVKEISREELGYLHIGRNITEYAWDGKDEFGGKLANGVYFYHIVTRLHGNQVDHMNTSADEYFKKGIGKMVIMR